MWLPIRHGIGDNGGMRFRLSTGLLALGCAVSVAVAADVSLVEQIVAKVNGDIITRGELERARYIAEAEGRQRGLPSARIAEAVKEAERDGLRDKIDNLLLIQKGKELNINVDGELSKYFADLQRKSGIDSPEKFQAYVKEQLNMPWEDYKNEVKNGMLTQRVVRQEVGKIVRLSDEEVKKYYQDHKDEFVRKEQVFLRQIVVSFEGKDANGQAAAKRKADDLVARARKGEKFPEMAQSNSDDQATAQIGGDIGGFEKGKLLKELEDQVWTKDRGYVTDPIKTEKSFLIFKVDEHTKAGLAEFEEAKGEIMDKLYPTKMQPAIRQYLTQLRTNAYLEIKPGYTDSGAAPGKDTTWKDPAELKPETVSKADVKDKKRRKHLLGVPLPGTTSSKAQTSSSR